MATPGLAQGDLVECEKMKQRRRVDIGCVLGHAGGIRHRPCDSRGNHRAWFIALILVGSLAVSTFADSRPSRSNPDDPSRKLEETFQGMMGDGMGDLFKEMSSLNWEKEASSIESSLDSLWKANGWTEESDQFAHDLARDVSKIPPWNFIQRFEVATDRVADRYGLQGENRSKFKSTIVREGTGMLIKHAPTIMKHSHEFVQTRLEGKPFTAEQVRDWSRESRAMTPDVRAMLNRIGAEVRNLAPTDKRELIERDMKCVEKRQKHFEQMSAKWARGEWSPKDWGLENDPIHKSLVADTSDTPTTGAAGTVAPQPTNSPIPRPTAPEAPPIPTRWIPHEPSTWVALVRDTVRKYKLDPGQVTSAESIHAELFQRANDYRTVHAEALNKVAGADRATASEYKPIVQLFDELLERLEAIPTTTQKQQSLP